MFVIIKYGANEEKLFNSNCQCSVLLSHVKRECGYDDLVENVDLASETGEVMDLVGKPKDYARKYLDARATYILLRVASDDDDSQGYGYVPLMDQAGEKLKFSLAHPSKKDKRSRHGEDSAYSGSATYNNDRGSGKKNAADSPFDSRRGKQKLTSSNPAATRTTKTKSRR